LGRNFDASHARQNSPAKTSEAPFFEAICSTTEHPGSLDSPHLIISDCYTAMN
jgi:hypothetical protein